LPLIVVRLSKK